MGRLLDKLLAVMRRDLLIALRYRTAMWAAAAGVMVEIAGFYFLSRAVGPGFRPDGMDFFSFLLIGTGVYGFLVAGIGAFVATVQEAQMTGTMEVLMTTSTPPPAIITLAAISAFSSKVLPTLLYLVIGFVFFGAAPRHPNLLGAAALLVLSLVVAVAIGIFAAALQVWMQRGSVVTWLLASVIWLLTGAVFPVRALPPALQKLAAWVPLTYSIEGLRDALVNSSGFSELRIPILALAGFSVVLLPASLWGFSAALKHARRKGTLSFY